MQALIICTAFLAGLFFSFAIKPTRERRLKRERNRLWAGLRHHTRRAHLYTGLLDVAASLGAHGEHLSRYASFRTANGYPVNSDSPAINLISLDGAIHRACYPDGVLPPTQLEQTAAHELLHMLHLAVTYLMPLKYNDVYEFANLAPFSEMREVLKRAISELEATCPSASDSLSESPSHSH